MIRITHISSVIISILVFGQVLYSQTLIPSENDLTIGLDEEKRTITFSRSADPLGTVNCSWQVQSFNEFAELSTRTEQSIPQLVIVPRRETNEVKSIICTDGGTDVVIRIDKIVARNAAATPRATCEALADKTEWERVEFFRQRSKEVIERITEDCEAINIVATPMLLDYATVRQNYGKHVGERFVVVQMNIQNKSRTSQFYLQNVKVFFDPNQCQKVFGFYAKTGYWEEQKRLSEQDFNTRCVSLFNSTFRNAGFGHPVGMEPVQSEKVRAVAVAGLHRSPRRIGFQIANFVSSMAPVLSGLKFLGSDGELAFGFLGSTIIPSSDKLIPSIAAEKKENLDKVNGEADIVIKPGSHKIINLFIESGAIFDMDQWKMYKRAVTETDSKTLAYRRMLKLFLASDVDGILIGEDAPRIKVTPSTELPGKPIL